jgi:Ca2+-transporting ATPase
VVDVAPRSWQQSAEAVADALASDATRGLTAAVAARRLEADGPNELVEARRPSVWRLIARQLANTMTAVLAVAAAITFLVGERSDTLVIGVIVVLNTVIGFVQEHRAEQAIAALRDLTAGTARVVRDGEVVEVPAASLVRGDLVVLAAGDLVPADLRLVSVASLWIGEAALTGESTPVEKDSATLDAPGELSVGDRTNVAHRGTAITRGRGSGLVVATGMDTELGRIAGLLGGERPSATPLQRSLADLGRRLAAAAVAVCVVVFAAGVLGGEPAHEMFLTAVSLAVAAIPEGLPAVVTVALALGARRMADHRAIVRSLPAVETLGSVSVICTDKTGTLTENRMLVERVWTPAGRHVVTGEGYGPEGTITPEGPNATEGPKATDGTVARDGPGGSAGSGGDPFLPRLARVAAACNDAVLRAPVEPGDPWTVVGDPTEGALVVLAVKLGVVPAELARDRPRVAELPFDAGRRRMTTVHDTGDGVWVAVKGGLEAVVDLLDPEDAAVARAAEAAAVELATQGHRVLALAERWLPARPEPLAAGEERLRLVGLVGITDPPRAQAAAAIATCRRSGMVPVMITGDHPGTARAVARRIGLLTGDETDVGLEDDGHDEVLTGAQVSELSDAELAARVGRVRVFARTDPEQKLRIVEAWQANGAVVAMTGDGVNDAPALRRSDIGVAMGITGTEVSKEAAGIVLADDRFETIVEAVEEGRRIFDNLRRFVRYLLTTNSGEIAIMLVAPLVGLPVPLLAVHLLWINVITDGLPALALGLEPPEPDAMRRPPRPADEKVLGRGLWQHALVVGALMAAVTVPLQAWSRSVDWPWPTVVFVTVALLQLGNALALRSDRVSVFAQSPRTNPWIYGAVGLSALVTLATVYVPVLQRVFHTESLSAGQLATVAVVSTAAFWAEEAHKWRLRRSAGYAPAAGI